MGVYVCVCESRAMKSMYIIESLNHILSVRRVGRSVSFRSFITPLDTSDCISLCLDLGVGVRGVSVCGSVHATSLSFMPCF